MNVVQDLLKSKFPSHTQFDLKQWDHIQHELVDAFIRKKGIHQDEMENYNSYLPEIINLLKEHLKLYYLDPYDQLHTIELLDAHYTLPYEEKIGVDSPERALLRAHYEAEIHGVIRYTIKVKVQNEKDKKPTDSKDTQSPEWHEEEDGDTCSPDTIPETQGRTLYKESLKSEKTTEQKNLKKDDAPEEDEEEEEEEEEDDNNNDDDEEEEEEEENDNEEEEEEQQEEEEEEEDDTKYDDEDEEETDLDEKSKKSKATTDTGTASSSVLTKRKNQSSDPQTELIPVVESSRNTTQDQPAFFIQKENYSAYCITIHEAQDHHHLLNIPPLIHSKICWMSTPFRDPFLLSKPYLIGGNYLVNRHFKLCPSEEYVANNRIFSLKNDKIEIRSKFYQLSKKYRTNSTLKFTLEYPKFRKNQTWYKLPRFMFEIPHETPKALCPIAILALAYGWLPKYFVQAVRMFLHYESTPEIEMFLAAVGIDTEGCRNQAEAIRHISKYLSKCRTMVNMNEIRSYVSFTLRTEFLPNLIDIESNEESDHHYDNLRKGYALAEVVAELIQLSDLINDKRNVQDKYQVADRRSYTLKRIDTPGEKITFLARKYIKHFAKRGQSNLKKAVDNRKGIDLKLILNKKMIKLTNSIKNGVWDSKADASDSNQNKTQMAITGYCSDALHAQVAKIIKFAMKKNSNPEPLLTHPDQAGRVDLYLTPESDRCGIVRNKAVGCWITPLVNATHMKKMILRIIQRHQSEIQWIPLAQQALFPKAHMTLVKDVFGGIIGWVADAYKMYQIFLEYRRKCCIWPMLGMEWDRKRNIFYFSCDEGRLLRPLIILERLQDLIQTTQDISFLYHPNPIQLLMEKGIIEYLDTSEEYCGLVFTADSLETAVKSRFIQTHMEIHGVLAMSVTVAKAFCNFNQGPRRMYCGNMEKRSIGMKLFEDRGTTASYSIWGGQDPLISDPIDQALQLRHKEPNGFNINLAVLSDKVNIEDSYVFKKEALERGMFVSSETMIITSSLGNNSTFQKPDHRTKGKSSEEKYEHIQADGTPKIGALIKGGMAIIGKVFFKKEGTEIKRRCVSKFLPWNEEYYVKSVSRYPHNPLKPAKIIRVSLMKTNWPNVGDKYFLRHGQKGTISEIRSAIDMPFYESGPMQGTSPDVLTNVCSLSRITQGLLLEMLWGRARTLNPTLVSQYHTIFISKISFAERERLSAAILEQHGLKYTGRQRMCMGTTGRPIQCEVFSGHVYMAVLKHMSASKLRSRDRGPINELTRQTSVGKKSYGGQRCGEMENWNLTCYGSALMFQSVNVVSGDKFLFIICTRCHIPAIGCAETGFYFCTSCKSRDHLVRLPSTFISGLTFQECMTAGFGHCVVARKVDPKQSLQVDEDHLFENYRQKRSVRQNI
jgi:DNA-directed RNA polymerase beta subunit